jgi:hypothetical protein
MSNKKGAIELSITTVIIIVIGVTLLILGLVLVRNIFSGATKTVDVLNDKTLATMAQLFTDETDNVIIKLGSDGTVSIAPGDSTNVVVMARTPDGEQVTSSRLKYTLTLDPANGNNCMTEGKLGAVRTKRIFVTPLDVPQSFDKASGSIAGASVELSVIKGTPICSQKVKVVVTDTTSNTEIGYNTFIVKIVQSGWF